MTEPTEAPTPWAVAKRLTAEGHPREVIVERLKQMGLDDDDVRVLLMDALARPTSTGSDGAGDLLKIGAVLVGGPILGGLVAAAITDAQETAIEERPKAPQVPLDAADPSSRCAWHPTLAAIGSCPRCGAFTCRDCAPRKGARWCVPCDALPGVQAAELRSAAKKVAYVFFFGSLFGIVEPLLALHSTTKTIKLVIVLGIMAGPMLLLGAIQLIVRHWWPAAVGIAFCVLMMFWGSSWFLAWALVLIALAVGISHLNEVTRRRRAS